MNHKCIHCSKPMVLDSNDGWIHTSGFYSCNFIPSGSTGPWQMASEGEL